MLLALSLSVRTGVLGLVQLSDMFPRAWTLAMTLDELRYFLEVAKAGSISRASVVLCMTQPALSRQIRKLEYELRTDLFYRHGRGVSLTDTGMRLHDVVAPILDQLSHLREEIREEGRRETGVVTLGVPPSIGTSICAPLALRFARMYPNAQLRIREAFSHTLSEWLDVERLDVAVLYDARRRRELLATPLIREKLYFIENRGPNPSDRAVQLAEIANFRLILPGPENGMRKVVDDAARAARITLNIVSEIDSVPVIRQLVAAGAGNTILPYGAVHADCSAGKLHAKQISDPRMEALLVVATPLNRPIARTTRALIKLIELEVSTCIKAGILHSAQPPLQYVQTLPTTEGLHDTLVNRDV